MLAFILKIHITSKNISLCKCIRKQGMEIIIIKKNIIQFFVLPADVSKVVSVVINSKPALNYTSKVVWSCEANTTWQT